MSLVGDRQELADALSAVDGVTGSKYRPVVMLPGSAWPLLGEMERGPGLDFQVTWRVVVVLPSPEQQASEWLDAHHEAITEALEPVGYVDRIEPTAIQTEAGDMDGAIFTLRKES